MNPLLRKPFLTRVQLASQRLGRGIVIQRLGQISGRACPFVIFVHQRPDFADAARNLFFAGDSSFHFLGALPLKIEFPEAAVGQLDPPEQFVLTHVAAVAHQTPS